MRHRIHRRATAQAFERFGQRAIDRPGVDALDLLKHGLGQLLLHRVELPVGQLLTACPHVQRQQATGENVLVDLLARLVRQLGVVGNRQVVRLVEGFQQHGAASLDVGFGRRPARVGAQRGRLALQGLPHRFAFQAGRQLHRLHALVDERLQLGRESRGIPDFDGIREAAHILYRDARQPVGNEFDSSGHGHLPGRFETGFTLVSLVAFVNLVA